MLKYSIQRINSLRAVKHHQESPLKLKPHPADKLQLRLQPTLHLQICGIGQNLQRPRSRGGHFSLCLLPGSVRHIHHQVCPLQYVTNYLSPFTPTNFSNYYDDFDFSAPSGGGNSSSVARSWQRRRRLQKPKQNNHDVRVVSCSGVPFDRLPGECVRNSESHLPAETDITCIMGVIFHPRQTSHALWTTRSPSACHGLMALQPQPAVKKTLWSSQKPVSEARPNMK